VHAKTAGAGALHLLVPLGRRYDYAQAAQLGALLAQLVADENPALASTERAAARRRGRVLVDPSLNRPDALLAAPFSPCAAGDEAVSTPLTWDEVDAGLEPARFTTRSLPARLQALGRDPMGDVLTGESDLHEALARLARRVG
jgi:bifunctional non-homologous end joining protein LigD